MDTNKITAFFGFGLMFGQTVAEGDRSQSEEVLKLLYDTVEDELTDEELRELSSQLNKMIRTICKVEE